MIINLWRFWSVIFWFVSTYVMIMVIDYDRSVTQSNPYTAATKCKKINLQMSKIQKLKKENRTPIIFKYRNLAMGRCSFRSTSICYQLIFKTVIMILFRSLSNICFKTIACQTWSMNCWLLLDIFNIVKLSSQYFKIHNDDKTNSKKCIFVWTFLNVYVRRHYSVCITFY
jgi:hypothetical protein